MKLILVVDDTAVFREPIAAALRRKGYETACAGDGREALLLVGKRKPDLILLDIAMPGMNGPEFLRAIRQDPATRGIPVIILSAMSETEALAEMEQVGVQGRLMKSQFSLADVANLVRQHLPAEPVRV